MSSCYLAAKGCSSSNDLETCCQEQDDAQMLPKVHVVEALTKSICQVTV